jgi:hypothetical protein
VIDFAAAAGRFDEATNEYINFRKLTASAVLLALQNAEPWSLFEPAFHDAHYAALRQMYEMATGSR